VTDAWIYAQDPAHTAEPARLLAELGFTPRRLAVNGSLRPAGDDGASADRPPALALVIASGAPAEGTRECLRVCARLREEATLPELPIVLAVEPAQLGAHPALLDAHELLVTPFRAEELAARIARARRRASGVEAGDVVRVGTLELNLATYQVRIDGRPVDFAYMEYELLKFLVTHPGRVFSRESLLNAVWGYDYYGGARTVDVHVRRVRAKLGSEHAARIKTVRSVGYRFDTTPGGGQ
jgi:two-component system, OmpR family, alkaline phosphatase synthesis response regulator PhoP